MMGREKEIAGSKSPAARSLIASGADNMALARVPAQRSERRIPTPFTTIDQAGWVVADSVVFVCGNDADRNVRCQLQDLNGASTRSSDAFSRAVATHDPRQENPLIFAPGGVAVATDDAAGVAITNLLTGATRTFAHASSKEGMVRWSPDGRALWVVSGPMPFALQQLDVATGGRATLMRNLLLPGGPPEASGFAFSDDRRTYAFTALTTASDLFLVNAAR